MTNPDLTAIKVVVDRSGSMYSIKTDAEGALKSFIESQTEVPGTATISLSEFNTHYNEVYPSINVNIAPLYTLNPSGGTALNDAIGKSVFDFGQELSALAEESRPSTVIFVIITDGEENSSKEYSAAAVKALIETQQNDYNWHFVFLAANQDAILTGQKFGFNANSSVTFNTTAAGVSNTSGLLTRYAHAHRAGIDYQMTDEDRELTIQ